MHDRLALKHIYDYYQAKMWSMMEQAINRQTLHSTHKMNVQLSNTSFLIDSFAFKETRGFPNNFLGPFSVVTR